MIPVRPAAMVLAFLPLLCLGAQPADSAAPPVECIAHRGGAHTGHTEETIPAYRAALALPVQVEGDIRWTATGIPVLLHDPDLGVFGAPGVNVAAVSTTTAKTYRSPSGDVIATLYEVRQLLAATAGARAQLELKTALTAAQWVTLADRLNPVRVQVTITSFSLASVRAAQDHGWRTGLIGTGDTAATSAPIYVEASGNVDAASVARLRSVGVTTQAWTPDTPAAWDTAAAAGVSGVITDDPAGCRAWAAAR
jgi:glycerophosphoryl diester phosphodiesterase